jgi:alkylhydroperoxidase family enzyme
MARIPLLQEDDPKLPPASRIFLQEAAQARGRQMNLYRALANRPEAGRAFLGLMQTIYRNHTTLEPKHAELAYLTATVVNNCHY